MNLREVALVAAYIASHVAMDIVGVGAPVAATVDVAFLVGFLYTLLDDVEKEISELGIHGIYNVMLVSWVAAIPQTVVAIYFARAGLYTAAFLDSMVSTLIDAFIVTALVRIQYLDAFKRDWHLILLWIAATLAFGATVAAPLSLNLQPEPYYASWFLLGAVGLPLLFARGVAGRFSMNMSMAINLAVNTILVIYTAWNLGQDLAVWHMSESQLGTAAALVATFPDIITALLIRAVIGRVTAEFAASEDAVRTMFAAAIHDQISDPALVLLIAPISAFYFPHWLNIYISLLKLTLLDRRAFLFIGLPAAVVTTAALMWGKAVFIPTI
ncbi:MAG: hypothetical protein JHC22_00145 [Thermoproteus sp.]|nr:hypothetical protein [Thermoproteus sp.]